MNKKTNHKHNSGFVIWLLLTLSMILLFPGAAVAAVEQDVNIYGGWNSWELNEPDIYSENTTIDIDEDRNITFEVAAPHEILVYGEIGLTGVTDSVYIDTLEVYLEYEESPGNWVSYEDRGGNDVILELINERTLYTAPIDFIDEPYPIDISAYDTVLLKKSLRWHCVLTGEENDTPFTDEKFIDISKWFYP